MGQAAAQRGLLVLGSTGFWGMWGGLDQVEQVGPYAV